MELWSKDYCEGYWVDEITNLGLQGSVISFNLYHAYPTMSKSSTFLQSYFDFFQWLSWYPMGLPSTLKIRKNSTADIMSWLTALRWQVIWGCFRSFVLHRIRVLPDLMMDTHRCIAIGRNCSLFRITRFHFRLFGIFCVLSVGCCWFVFVLPWSSAIVCC